ncbi:MAG: peptide MFS transporter [Flavobacteriia bacterium]|jgi:POT family proton-dependent oligopeptide transporter
MENNTSQKHPQGLYVLFATEMWERFSYYGMRALFLLFLGKALLFDKETGSQIYGSYTGLVYLTPLIGGYVADRYWGNRKSIVIGGLLMAFGQFMMFLAGSFFTEPSLSTTLMFTGLGFLIFGNGFFKPNISTMVGQLYPQGDKRVDSAFTIFYMGINLGAFIAPLLCGAVGETGNPADFKWGFLLACIGMIVSVLLFVAMKNHYIVSPEGLPIGGKPERKIESDVPEVKMSTKMILTWVAIWLVLLGGFYFLLDGDIIGSFIFSLTIAAPGFIISDPSLSKIEKQRIWVIYIVAFFVIFFWAAFEQAGASLTYFADEQTDRFVFLKISSTTLLIVSIILSLVSVFFAYKVYKAWFNSKGWPMALMIYTFMIGAVVGLFYLWSNSTSTGYLNIEEIPASAFQSVNAVAIVLCAPIFVAIWGFLGKRKMEPSSPYKQAIGLLLLAVGYAVIAVGVKGIEPGVKVSMMWLVSLYTIHTFGELCLSPIGLSMVNKLAPIKFASLLMGVWFLSTATANKFAGTLSALYPEDVVSIESIKKIEKENTIKLIPEQFNSQEAAEINGQKIIPVATLAFADIKDLDAKNNITKIVFKEKLDNSKSFLGFKITTLYDFFMLFVFMAGIASVILFILSKFLMKMMNGIR